MNPVKLLMPLALCCAILSPIDSFSQTPAPAGTNVYSAERFLVIVETSAAMQKRAENAQKALGSVISSGLGGHMASGSTIGMWTFNDRLLTGQLPLQLWTPATRQRVAMTLVQFLQQQKYEKSPRLAAAWAAATNIIAQSEHITVLLITSGTEPLVGTPFDEAIRQSFSKNAEAQRKQNMPFLTILRAVRGKIVAFAVNMPPWPLEVPEYPDGLKPVPPPPPPLPKVETNPAPAVVKRRDPAILSPTNTIFLTETSPPVEVPVAPPTPEPTNPAAAVPQSPATNTLTPVPAGVQPGTNPGQMVSTPAVSTPAAEKKLPIMTILIAGITLLLVVLIFFIALLRRSQRSTGASLITRSMDKGPK